MNRVMRFLDALKSDFNVPTHHRVEALRLLDDPRLQPRFCIVCKARVLDYYMVQNSTWGNAGFAEGQAHMLCLQERLGRPLTLDDFTPAPVNNAIRFGYGLPR